MCPCSSESCLGIHGSKLWLDVFEVENSLVGWIVRCEGVRGVGQ